MNKFEQLKQDKDGLDVYDALMRATAEGWEILDEDDVARLKWYGLYPHNSKDGHFMLRTKVVQGVLTGDQAELFADLADEYAHGYLDCTTRQCIQLHWIRLEQVPDILHRFAEVGLTTLGACGDITRNVVGCTLAGIAHDQVADGQAVADSIHRRFLGNREYSNLPRKFKISVTGCAEDCARGLINDVALSGAVAVDGTPGFNLRVGGGLSSHPRFARWVDVWVSEQQATDVVEQVVAIFRDSQENRKSRGKARIKFLVDRLGPEAFRDELERRCGFELEPGAQAAPDLRGHDHIGVTPQADGRHSAVGLCVPVGRVTGARFREVARLAREYGSADGQVRLTHQQNVLIPWVANERVEALLAEPLPRDELPAEPPLFTRGLQTCTGKEFCGLAKVHTKERAREIARFLDTNVRPNGHGDDLRVHFAGCSSSCAQHQIADIGIEGVLKKVDGEFVEAMDIRIGGHLGPQPKFGDVVVRRVPHWDLNETLLRIFDLYEQSHADGETFAAFAARTETGWWSERLVPEPVEA
ncbi:MAG: ferredoxin--nitrite reductase [Thermoleophilaceae bacterium]|nr:ferredoxin--nitrite reductase [Thermoleophilaceae bacterium]